MDYLEEFQSQCEKQDFANLLKLWEEYGTNENVDSAELYQVLELIKNSKLGAVFGPFAETILPLWEQIPDGDLNKHKIFRITFDLQTSNSQALAERAFNHLKLHHGDDKLFNEKMRLVGLRKGDRFEKAISSYELLSHMEIGNFVFHHGGWGTGEIIDVSLVREQLVIEFEYVVGRKDVPFEKAFKNLTPLPVDHFLSRRFGNPDKLETEARLDPVGLIRLLLRDLGRKTALEIKDELCELVIPEPDWSKWWQSARAKIKKDTMIETPPNIRQPFILRSAELTHEDRFKKALDKKSTPEAFTLIVYTFLRDFTDVLNSEETRQYLKTRIFEKLSLEQLTLPQKLQLYLIIQDTFPEEAANYSIKELLENVDNLGQILHKVEISGLKKRALQAIQKHDENWPDLFAKLLLSIQPNSLREFIFKELNSSDYEALLKTELQQLLVNPRLYPEAFVWYCQKIVAKSSSYLFNDKESQCRFFEAFLILMQQLEVSPDHRDLVKKMYTMISEKRYLLIRNLLENSKQSFAEEFLLLITKCQSLKEHDSSILHSLVEVAHPTLAQKRKTQRTDDDGVIWVTQDGFNRLQDKIRHIGSVETVDNAKEIEAARALGDLRENAEFKSALERRTQLQSQLKSLTDQLNASRIITKDDISVDKVGVGTIVTLLGANGTRKSYTLLGPWEADTDRNILSIQSKFAQSMSGHKPGDQVTFQEEEYTIEEIASYAEHL